MNLVSSTGTAGSLVRKSSKTPAVTTPAAGATPGAEPPYFNYVVPGHGNTTQGLKDTAGDTWYKTQGGQWRNEKTQKVQSGLPSWQAAAAAPAAPTTPAAAPAATPEANPQWKSLWDFTRTQDQSLFNPQAAPESKSMWDFYKQQGTSPAYTFALDEGNKSLEKRLSAMGLTGSGADIEGHNAVTRSSLADEVGRLMQGAAADSNTYNTNQALGFQDRASTRDLLGSLATADFQKYTEGQQMDADREVSRDSQGITTIGMALDFLKSLNPMQYAFPATNTVSQNYLDLGKQLAGYAAAPSGGGGGGSSGGGSSASLLPESPGGFSGTSYFLDTVKSFAPVIANLLK